MTKAKTPKKSLPKAAGEIPLVTSNRRREWRLDLPLPTLIEGKLPRGEKFREQTVLGNISSGGAYFTLESGVVVGSKLNIIIDLPAKLTEGRRMKLLLGGVTVRLEEIDKKANTQGVAVRFHKDFRFVAEPSAKKPKKA